jgi:hypothetical protein
MAPGDSSAEISRVTDGEVLEQLDEINDVYEDLWEEARARIHTWGPAANAKTLHQLVPGLYVMWDRNIEPFADGYADFMAEMHRLGVRMIQDSPYDSRDELEQRMQSHLGYGVWKTLAKYLDEFNWYEMVGAGGA